MSARAGRSSLALRVLSAALALPLGAGAQDGSRAGAAATVEPAPAPDRAGQRAPATDEELAVQFADLLARLYQISFAHNFELGLGPTDDRFHYLLNVRPTIPVVLAGEWLLLMTGFIRFHYFDGPVALDATDPSSIVGMGDVEPTLFITTPSFAGLHVGLGPYAILPSSDPRLGSVNVGVGPAAAVSWRHHGLVIDLQATHAFSFVDDETDYSITTIIPVISYVFDTATSITVQSETVYEWHRDRWTVPIGAGIGQVVSFSRLVRMSFALQGRWWPVRADTGPDWGVRVVTTLLFPEILAPTLESSSARSPGAERQRG